MDMLDHIIPYNCKQHEDIEILIIILIMQDKWISIYTIDFKIIQFKIAVIAVAESIAVKNMKQW
jgi:hypothetical protein